MANKKGKLTFAVFAMIFITDAIESVAELFFKNGTLATGISNVTLDNVGEFLTRLLASSGFWTGSLLHATNFFLWVAVLSKIDLSVAFSTGSMSYIMVALLSMIYLHEHISLYRWGGIVFIIIGIWFISRSTRHEEAAQ